MLWPQKEKWKQRKKTVSAAEKKLKASLKKATSQNASLKKTTSKKIKSLEMMVKKLKAELAKEKKAATNPYTLSAIAAPKPTDIAPIKPSWIVLRIQITPIGPTGAAIATPMTQALKKTNIIF